MLERVGVMVEHIGCTAFKKSGQLPVESHPRF